jgi:hypothetical protein
MLKNDLDAVSKDLDRLSKGGQSLELHATFDKFGKTANLQVHDAPTDNGEGDKPNDTNGLKLFKVPAIRQVRGFCYTSDCSTFIEGFYIEVWNWKRLGRWNCSSICFMLESSRSMLKPSRATRVASNYTYLR